ncbi:MAG: response regulator [Actinomycetota bacterium]
MSSELYEAVGVRFASSCLAAPYPPDPVVAVKAERTIVVMVADGERLLAEGIASGLARFSDLSVLGQHPASATEALGLAEALKPDVVLIDFLMRDMAGSAAAGAMRVRVPECKVIIMSSDFGPAEINAALQAGAAGFLPKNVGLDIVADAVRRVFAGECPVYPGALQEMIDEMRSLENDLTYCYETLARLTSREDEILRLLSDGPSVKEVADRLFIAHSTCKTHIHHILEKTQLKRMREVISMARKCGWLRQ